MQKNTQPTKKSKLGNIILIAALVVIAVGLLIASRYLLPSDNTLTQTEINEKISALAPTEAPAAEATEFPAQEVTEAPAAEATEVPHAGEETKANYAEGYLFIIRDGYIWGIEPLGEERDVTVDQGNGVVNVIHIQEDGFYMQSSTCDNQLCVGEGTVTLTNWQERILGPCVYCLPHNLILELVVPNAEPDPNAPDA